MKHSITVRTAIASLIAVVLACPAFGQDESKQQTEKPTHGQGWTVPELGMKFVYVKPGKFRMGWQEKNAPDRCKPVHQVKISKGFWMGKYEVTQKQYKKLMGKNPSHFDGNKRPVEKVSWHDAMKFCRKLIKRERQAGRLPEGYEYRLPTEAEWEYAARDGHKSEERYKYSGSDDINKVAWYRHNRGFHTYPVGRKQPNELGIYDMSGNVWEWCLDSYQHDYYEDNPRVDPVNTSKASHRVYRGGSWLNAAQYCRSAYRFNWNPDDTRGNVGFRVVLAPPVQ